MFTDYIFTEPGHVLGPVEGVGGVNKAQFYRGNVQVRNGTGAGIHVLLIIPSADTKCSSGMCQALD